MKRLLAILLILVLCLGLFASCDNNEESSSSESGASNARDLSFYNSATSVNENHETYYNLVSNPDVLGYLASSNIFGDPAGTLGNGGDNFEWYIVDTYEEYITIICDGGVLDRADFEKNIVVLRYGVFNDSKYYNFRIEDNVAHIDCDSFFSKSGDTYQPAYMNELDLILVPRAHVNATGFNVREVVLNNLTHSVAQSSWYEATGFDFDNGDTWVIDEQNDWNELKVFLDDSVFPTFDFEKNIYVVVCREKSSVYTESYCYPEISDGDKEMTIECFKTQDLYAEGNEKITTGFDFIAIPKTRFANYQISQDIKAKIVIKTSDYTYSKLN